MELKLDNPSFLHRKTEFSKVVFIHLHINTGLQILMGREAFAIGQWRAGVSPKAGLQFSDMKVHSDISQSFLLGFFTAREQQER